MQTVCPAHASESESRSVVSDSLQPHGLYSPWNSPGQNTEVGTLSLLQGIFPTQGSNSGLLHCRRILLQLSHKGSPRILEWVAYPFSSESLEETVSIALASFQTVLCLSYGSRFLQLRTANIPTRIQNPTPNQDCFSRAVQ